MRALLRCLHAGHNCQNRGHDTNDQLRVNNLDFLEEDRETAHIQLLAYKEKIKKIL